MIAESEPVFGALCRLDPGWRIFRDRRIAADGEQYRIQFIIMHRDYGVGLVVLARQEYTSPEIAVRVMRTLLQRSGFDREYRGFLPIVFVALNVDEAQAAPTRIAKAFAASPAIGIRDGTWVDWVSNAFEALGEQTSDAGPAAASEPIELDVEIVDPPRRRRRPRRWLLGGVALGALLLAAGGLALLPGGADGVRPDRGPGVIAASITRPLPDDAPRLMSEAQTALYLSLDLTTFRRKYPALRASGFPVPEPITGNYDRAAIDRWLDAQAHKQSD
jgi:hypothetical protein